MGQAIRRKLCELGKEYKKRYGKKHLTIVKCEDKLAKLPGGILETGLTDMPQCMPDEYKDECSIQAYWNYYINDKKNIANLKTETLYEERPETCLLYTSPSPRDGLLSRMPSSA